MKEEKTFIGIDVSKEKLDVGVRPQVDFMTFANTYYTCVSSQAFVTTPR
jgi:hypothetical protein